MTEQDNMIDFNDEELVNQFHEDQEEFKKAFEKFNSKWGKSIVQLLVSNHEGQWAVSAIPMRSLLVNPQEKN